MQRAEAGGRLSRTTLVPQLVVAAIAVAAAVLMTWPLARTARDHVLAAIYHWDAYTNTMILGSRVDGALGRGPLSLYDNYFFAPLPNTIAFNENHFGLSLLFAPFYLTTKNPLLAYNLTLLSSMALSVFFTYLLVRRLTKSEHAGLLGGVAFAFCPYVMFELGRIQLVAAQWIPACFLFLHRAIEGRRLRDVVGLWLSYLLQIGTCLYYAMFLIPLLSLVGAVLLFRQRPPRRFYFELAAVGAVAACVAVAMVYPYFSVRDAFDLERSVSFASSYDGKLGFFANVHDQNRTLTAMHRLSEQRGAHEEIAFPGFTVLAMVLASLGVPLWRAFQDSGGRKLGVLLVRWLAIGLFALAVTLLLNSMLAGAVVLGFFIFWQARRQEPFPFCGQRGLYLALLLLSIVLFLGLAPLEWDTGPVRGLYYYFHAYFPGFNGIRKVSRQAIMTSFAFAVVAAFGSAWLFSKLGRLWQKNLLLSVLLLATCYELRCFPLPVRGVWTGDAVPEAYRFLATLPRHDYLAILPQNDGVERFWGDRGMALHNYLALYHKHRFVNGQSSYTLPVTELVRRALYHLPEEGARRVLESIGARHLLVHAEDLKPERKNLPELLASDPEHYRRIFKQGSQSVFTLLNALDPEHGLEETPPLPAGARQIPRSELRAGADLRPEQVANAVDGDSNTYWTGRRFQAKGQYFELVLSKPRRIVAFEIDNPDHVMDVPLSFDLSVKNGASGWRKAAEKPVLRVYREQVYSPKTFVFRVVLKKPVVGDHIRIRIGQAVPGHYFTVHEARVYSGGT